MNSNRTAFPKLQAVLAATEGGDACGFAAELEALDQKFRSLGAAAPSPIVLNFKPLERNTLRGFFDLELPSGLVLSGCTLHEKDGKFWTGLRAKPWTKPDGSQSWSKVIDFRDRETSDKFQRTVTPIAIVALERMRGAA
jgi:hypothetical protein